jgi:arsenite methyltransferase
LSLLTKYWQKLVTGYKNKGPNEILVFLIEMSIQTSVQEYYGKVLQSSKDLKTNACCTRVSIPAPIRAIIGELHEEVTLFLCIFDLIFLWDTNRKIPTKVVSKYYGCGLPIPNDFANLNGLRVLDLGSGSGRDCYILSKLVGPNGYVVGVDMTDEQIATSQKHIEYHTKLFGYSKPNVEFLKGYIEHLDQLNLPLASFDLVVSNCVLNLSPDKESVLRGVYALLKPGGEMYFSDVYSDRRVPQSLRENEVLWGECLSGALYWNDFINLSKKVGFLDVRMYESSVITIANDKLKNLVGKIRFYSATYRLFKLLNLESDCEDYGQAVVYNGRIPNLPDAYQLDDHHIIETGRVFPVCGNTLAMLCNTRMKPFFSVYGDGLTHYGIFSGCGKSNPFQSENEKSGGGCC